MPVYEYLCDDCGPFTAMRPMAECDEPHTCPDCRSEAPRVLLTAPHCTTLSPERRRAHATNERSAHAPKSLAEHKAAHPSGCSCCSGRSSRFVARGKTGSKSFPTSRPWMISH
ncbi:MAG TPA: zinc ribbon domain-containing protein [Xanthobacteraceae bacterium]|nr:zinc ribbon domain-containing protein [Xanthobacteraceae bacterium]